jgi:hypothetical protein
MVVGVPGNTPKEAELLIHSLSELQENIVSAMKTIAGCLGAQRGTYNSQIKRMRDISNAATRNAIQVRVQVFPVYLQELFSRSVADIKCLQLAFLKLVE